MNLNTLLFYNERSLFVIISTIINTEDHTWMLIQPRQNNIVPRQILQLPATRQLPTTNSYNNAVTSRITVGNSPPVNVITQSHRVNQSPSHHYMMHLVPQQPTIVSHVATFNPGVHVVRSASSSLLIKFSDKKSQPLTQSILTVQRPQVMINNNTSSTGFRSRGTSELSNKKSRLTNVRNQYMIPQSPSNLRKMQPVRRVSKHKLNISTSDQQGQQQQNIRIIIQTDSIHQPNNTPSKITIEHIQGAANHQMNATNGSFVVTSQPQANQMTVINDYTPKVTPVSQNKLNGSTHVDNNLISQPTNSQITPVAFQQRTENRGYSYSMDSKHLQRQSKHKAQIKSHFKSKQQTLSPQIIVIDPPSDLFIDKKPISFSEQQQHSQFMDSQSSKKHQKHHKMKEQESSSTSKREKNKLSIQSSKANHQQRKKLIKEVYNEYYDESDEQVQSILKEKANRHNYIIYKEQNSLLTSTVLLNQIYENEVHKALLKMNVVQNRSREKSIKRRNY